MDEQTRKAMESVLVAAVEFHEADADPENGTTAKAEHWAKFRASLDTYCLGRTAWKNDDAGDRA